MNNSNIRLLNSSGKVKTICPYCGVGCGVVASCEEKDSLTLSGDPHHPANFGRLCTKGMTLGDTIGLESRLKAPMRRKEHGLFHEVTWDQALDEVSAGLKRIIQKHGPNSVAFYLSGQLLTEDYYVANKLMKGFIGSSNVDTNSRLCMASTVAGHRRAFGTDTVPACYDDIDETDLIVIVGSNTAWCHPILFQRMLNRRSKGAKIVAIDTRRTVTADSADLFLEILPGSDQELFCGLLAHLSDSEVVDKKFISEKTNGYEEALKTAKAICPTIRLASVKTGVDENIIQRFFELFATTKRVITVFSQGVNQSSQGVDKVNAIINCHLATGRIGKPGASPFSFTGQPNAMGGREVGGLANMLAAHMGFDQESKDRVKRFWNAPHIAQNEGLKAIQMFESISSGEVKALWVCGTNPAASLPDADRYRRAYSNLDLFIVSDVVMSNDTIKSGAHILLPAHAWGEKNGTVTNSERRISRQRAFLAPPENARSDWDIFASVARRMGYSGFDYTNVQDIFREHAELSAFENDGARDFNIGGLSQLTDDEYNSLEPIQWPVYPETSHGQTRFFEDGKFYTSDQRANFVSIKTPHLASTLTPEFPLYLNTGRLRDQWHTMTRTGLSEKLAKDNSEAFVEINPQDAEAAELVDGGFAIIQTVHGQCVMRVNVTERQAKQSIFVPIHWTDENSSNDRVGALVAPNIDPISGQPELKATPARVSPILFKWEAYLITDQPLRFPEDVWWTRVAVKGAVAYRLAGNMDMHEFAAILNDQFDNCNIEEITNHTGTTYRAKCLDNNCCRFLLLPGAYTAERNVYLDAFRTLAVNDDDILDFLHNNEKSKGKLDKNDAGKINFVDKPQRSGRYMTDIFKYLRKVDILRRVSDHTLKEYIHGAKELVLKPGEILFEEGETGDSIYVILSGLIQIYVTNPSGEEVVLGALSEGDLLGEHYLTGDYDSKRGASARAKQTVKILQINGNEFMNLLIHDPLLAKRIKNRRDKRENKNLIKRSEMYRVLSELDAVDPQSIIYFVAGEVIFREGDEPDAAWLIINGTASVYHEGASDNPIASLGPGQCFGERACLDNTKRNASVKASTSLEAIKISKEHFIRLHSISDELKAIVSGLNFLYHLNQRGVALQYFSNKNGQVSIERVYRLHNGQRFLSSWTPELNVFRLDRIDQDIKSDRLIEAEWSEPTGDLSGRKRLARLIDGKIHHLSVIGEWPELSNLIEAAIDGYLVDERSLRAFKKSGRLDVQIPVKDDEQVCFCLGITSSSIKSQIQSGCDTFEALRDKTGCGSVCGGCEPQIQSMLGRSEWIPITAESIDLADGVRSFTLKPSLISDLEWKTGQFVVISGRIGEHWVNRSYTIVSAPGKGAQLEVAIKREPKGLFSSWLFDGDLSEKELRISPPRGNSIWNASGRHTVCFVAGIGITPAIAILRARQKLKSKGYLHIDYSGRVANSMAYISELDMASSTDEGLKVVYRFTSKGSRISKDEIRETIKSYQDADYFLCGPEPYLDSVISELKEANVPSERIFEERFAHAGGPVTHSPENNSSDQIVGPDSLLYFAQNQALSEGKTLTPEECVKRDKHPLDRWDEIVQRSRSAQYPAGTDIFITKYFGLFYVAPAQDSFMCRLRIPNGILMSWQARGLAQASMRLGGGYLDVTTRANLQIRNIEASSAVDMLFTIQSLGLTSRGAGADNIRNITGSPTAGIDPNELIDTRPLCLEMHHYILNHRELYGLPRKFNIAFNGGGGISVLEETNDIGFSAVKVTSGPIESGVYFRLLLGGATGHGDFAFDSEYLVRPNECVSLAGAILRVFTRLGDRTNRQKARLKFLIDNLGRNEFLLEVEKEWGQTLIRSHGITIEETIPSDTHGHIGVYPQKQPGLYYIGVQLPVGRLTSDQLSCLADISEQFGSGTIRLTVWQNLIISDISDKNLEACINSINKVGLETQAGAFRSGLVACTGSAGCKFAAADTKAHALKLANYLESRFNINSPINIHFTGCRNSCAQHYIGDIGLIGAKVDVNGKLEEGYNIFIGGGSGLSGQIAKEYANSVTVDALLPTVEGLIDCWIKNRSDEKESFCSFTNRFDAITLRKLSGMV